MFHENEICFCLLEDIHDGFLKVLSPQTVLLYISSLFLFVCLLWSLCFMLEAFLSCLLTKGSPNAVRSPVSVGFCGMEPGWVSFLGTTRLPTPIPESLDVTLRQMKCSPEKNLSISYLNIFYLYPSGKKSWRASVFTVSNRLCLVFSELRVWTAPARDPAFYPVEKKPPGCHHLGEARSSEQVQDPGSTCYLNTVQSCFHPYSYLCLQK